MPLREFEVTAPDDTWLTMNEIGGDGDMLRVPCSNTSDITAVESAILVANMQFRYEAGGRLIAFVGHD